MSATADSEMERRGPAGHLVQAAAEPVAGKIRGALPAGEEVLLQVESDLDGEGRFASRWVVATPRRVLVVPAAGADGIVEVPVDQLAAVRAEPLVGGGRLEIERRGRPTVLVPYSDTAAPWFSEVARGLEQLRQGEDLRVSPKVERIRCAQCGRLLPERDGLCPACIEKWATLKRICRYMAPYRGRAALLALASLATTAAELAPPLVTRRLIDAVLVPAAGSAAPMDQRLRLLGTLVLALVGIRVTSWIAEWVHGWIVVWLGAHATADIRGQLYRRLEMLSLQFYDKRKVGALMSRVTRDSGRLQEFLVNGLPYLVINGLMIAGIVCLLTWMSWHLTVFALLPVPVLLVWGALFWRRMHRYFTKWGERWSDLTDRTAEALSGIRVVKAFAQEPREIEAFGRANREVSKIGIVTSINRTVFFATISLFTGVGVLIVWLLGGRQVLAGELTLGTLLAFYSYMWMVYGPLEWFGQVNSWMSRAFAGAERVFEVIDTEPESYQDPDAVRLPEMRGRIAFRDVTFGYDKSKPVLRDLDLEVEAGEMIGLVGKSGVGKTTMVNLIARFYDVDQGAIEVDGVDLRRANLRDLRRQIGIVLQEPVLFSGTIADNIGYGKPGARFEEVMRASRLANAHSFIVAKPDGYDTQVGEQGGNLSGGERQRVAIARALLHNPRILILDEATSSVDVETERQIQQAIGRMTEGRTTFAIAHRLSTLRHASRLVVLEGGRIVESGTHAELMARRGPFHQLVEMQQEAAQIIAIAE
ncbi:MAG: ABC transporter transmembrane domain-containing protein [Gemmatimonadota bacterium]